MRKIKFIAYLAIIFSILVSCSPAPPKIPEEALTGSAELIDANPEIEEPEIIVEDDTLKFYLIPAEGQEESEERLKQLGVDFMKLLGGYVSSDEIAGPSDESYGEIYDYYNVEIIVEGERGAVLYRGIKAKGESEIQWEE
ncbi:hypothetical protein [Tissierella sp. Yu-01]|uniref:hypothetical protein n=1 Tax=Tissierella sp. Yu-01 TaxID=3035694 RepID=UPI00240D925F|nr:hypothetical protein [Tissierella sp. Yu-01]WFA08526.1 hypothetical protein P3962_12465 [Tissierella sp. Yu-01]